MHAEDITPAEASAWLAGGDSPTIVDVRTTAEYDHDHIAGAVNVPLPLVESHADAIAAALSGEVLLVCRADPRARRAATVLAGELGPRAHVLTGGMQAWQKAGLAVEEGAGGPWAMERQVRTTAGSIVLASILGSQKIPALKWVGAGIGAGLLYSGLSDTCGMAALLGKAPWNRGRSTDLDNVLANLAKQD